MLYKYRYVKVEFPNGVMRYAYEKSMLGFFKSYLDVSIDDDKRWYPEEKLRDAGWLSRDTLQEVRDAVRDYNNKISKLKITDAETKLDRHLGGLE